MLYYYHYAIINSITVHNYLFGYHHLKVLYFLLQNFITSIFYSLMVLINNNSFFHINNLKSLIFKIIS